MRTVFFRRWRVVFLCCSCIHLRAQENITMDALRNSGRGGGMPSGYYHIADHDKEGVFAYDAGDRTSPDDSAMVVVTASGARYKRRTEGGKGINVKWFGARGDGSSDDWYAIQKGIRYILGNDQADRTLYFPAGGYPISKPLIIARPGGNQYRQASISLVGPAPSRTISAGYAHIMPAFNNTFAIGIQMGKGVLIKDLMITGRFVFPDRLNEIQVDTLSFSEWTDGSSRDDRFSPYAGIVIDPFSDPTAYPASSDMYPGLQGYYLLGMSRAGSTSVEITGCSIRNFVVGVMITPSNQQNGDLIDVIDCDISGSKVAYSMGQAQSKECHVLRLKCWQPVHTVFDNSNYGVRHGDGSAIPMVDGVNIASHVKQLCSIYAASFNGVFRNVYAEGLFRLGYVGGPATVSFEDCQIDFSTNDAGLPYPDFYVLGSGASFRNCLLRLYPGVPGARLILSGTDNSYEGGVMNGPPVAVNIDDNPNNPNPYFADVTMYYSGGVLGSHNGGWLSAATSMDGRNGHHDDPVYPGNVYTYRDPFYGADVLYRMRYDDTYERVVRLSGTPVLHTDTKRWTGFFRLASNVDMNVLQPGDFILTSGLHYQDQYSTLAATTYPVGIVREIGHDTVYLTNLAYGIRDGKPLSLWADYCVYAHAPMTGDLASGSNMLVKVQGRFPVTGERLDMPMLPSGTFVTSVDARAGTISFSNRNMTGRSFSDYTFINGFPKVDMYSCYALPLLQQSNKTLIGGADFYRLAEGNVNTHDRDFPLIGMTGSHYKVLHTNFRGDTSLHKMLYQAITIGDDAPAPAVEAAAPGTSAVITGNDLNMQIIVKTAAPVSGDIVHIRLGSRCGTTPLPVVSNGNAFSAGNSGGLYGEAEGLTGLVIGGKLLAAGTYVFNVSVSQ